MTYHKLSLIALNTRYNMSNKLKMHSPNGASQRRQAAAMAPAEAPATLFTYKSGAYLIIKMMIHFLPQSE